jgi:hypothetical protein
MDVSLNGLRLAFIVVVKNILVPSQTALNVFKKSRMEKVDVMPHMTWPTLKEVLPKLDAGARNLEVLQPSNTHSLLMLAAE